MRSVGPAVGLILGVSLVFGSTVLKAGLWLVYNATDSAPRGLYVVNPVMAPQVGDYVVARLPEATAAFAAERGYLPRSIPVLKQIAAADGQHVCVRDGRVYVDETVVARTLNEDGQRRELRGWDQCRRLLPNELFLLNPDNSASFDSRYFGPIDASFVRGRATRW